MPLRVIVLGAAAGGGLPQWNCGCPNCRAARAGQIPSLTQSSLAISADGETWAVLNASPDLRAQIAATPALHPTGPRSSPLRAVLLTNGDIDHVAGLLTLREKQSFVLHATREILDVIAANPVFGALDPALVDRAPLTLDAPTELLPGLIATVFAVPGKLPLYLEGENPETALEGEQTVGVEIAAEGRTMLYVPGCARISPALADRITRADLLFFDGTLWQDDEMIRAGLGQKTGRRMGHMPISGPGGSLDALATFPALRKVYVHMNNTNPVLVPGSAEAEAVRAAGWTVARDGMEVTL